MASWLSCLLAYLSPRSLIKFPVLSLSSLSSSLWTQVENIPTASQRHQEHLCFCWLNWSIPVTLYVNMVQPTFWLINSTRPILAFLSNPITSGAIHHYYTGGSFLTKIMNVSLLFLVREQSAKRALVAAGCSHFRFYPTNESEWNHPSFWEGFHSSHCVSLVKGFKWRVWVLINGVLSLFFKREQVWLLYYIAALGSCQLNAFNVKQQQQKMFR